MISCKLFFSKLTCQHEQLLSDCRYVNTQLIATGYIWLWKSKHNIYIYIYAWKNIIIYLSIFPILVWCMCFTLVYVPWNIWKSKAAIMDMHSRILCFIFSIEVMIKTLDTSAFLKRCNINESLYHVYARCKDIKYNNRQLKQLDDLIMSYLNPQL